MAIGAKLNIVVKVGTSSTLKFNNVKAYRAITYDDVSRLLGSRDDISLIIVEDAEKSDMQQIEDIVSLTDLNTYLYNPNFEVETGTTGLLQGEFESDHVYLFKEQDELQNAISEFYGIDIRTYVPVKKINETEELENEIESQEDENWPANDLWESKPEDFDNFNDFESETSETVDDNIIDVQEKEEVETEGQEIGNVTEENIVEANEQTEELESIVDKAEEKLEENSLLEGTNSNNVVDNNIITNSQESEASINDKDSTSVENIKYETEEKEIIGSEKEKDGEYSLDSDKQNEDEHDSLYRPENAELYEALSASLGVGEDEEKEDTSEKEKEKVTILSGRKEDTDSDDVYMWNAENTDTFNSVLINESNSEEVEKLREELSQLNEHLEYEKDRAESYEALVEKLREIKENLEDKLDFYEDLIHSLQTTDDIIDISIQDSEETLNKIEELKIEKLKLQEKINSLTRDLGKLTELELEITRKDNEYAELKSELDRVKQDNRSKEIEERYAYEKEVRLKLTELLESVAFKYSLALDSHEKTLQTNRDLEAAYKNETRLKKELEVQSLELKSKLQQAINLRAERERVLNLKLEEFSRINEENAQKSHQAEREKQGLLDKIADLQSDLDLLKSQEDNYKSRISTLDSQLSIKDNQIESLEAKLNRYKDINIEDLRESVKTSELGNSKLVSDIGRLKIEISGLQRQLSQRSEVIGRLESEKSQLELTAKSLSNSVTTAEKLRITCNYSGKAMIIPVYGTGSYGVTTTAVTLAKKLNGDVLLLDFDCVNPKLDSWTGLNPMLDQFKEMTETRDLPSMAYSAFGILIEKGTDFIINNQDIAIQHTNIGASKLKKGTKRVDYFSGVYYKIDLYKFAAIDFSSFLNFFGNEYEYIVVDLGRIGGNESTNALIRMFDTIAWRSVQVCQNDKYDVRILYTKIKMEGLHLGKAIWLLNMAKSTALDEFSKKVLNNARVVILTKKPELYGEQKTFDVFSNFHKEKIQQVVEWIDGTD